METVWPDKRRGGQGRHVTQYIIRRLIQSLFIIWGCATPCFFMLRMIPGDPVIQMLGPEVHAGGRWTPSSTSYGLDQPLHIQYMPLVRQRADRRPGGLDCLCRDRTGAIARGLPKTFSLALLSFVIALIIAV